MAVESAVHKSSELLKIDDAIFNQNFPHHGFKIAHQLCDEPEFRLERLIQLAQRMPENQVEYYSGKVGINQDPDKHPKNGLSIVETVRRIEECGSWMVLKNVQSDPDYGRLLRRVLDEIYGKLERGQLGPHFRNFHREEGFIFISSPNSITPYHLDEEHNFLAQIRGSKEISMWDPQDRTVLPEPQIEYMLQVYHGEGYHRNMEFKDEFQQRATVFPLTPGEALHFPVGAPHWVKNGPEVSISFSFTFRSEMSKRQAVVYFLNRKLRNRGLKPTPPGVSAMRDSMKYGAFQGSRLAGGILKKRQNKWT